jgi:hypothetical protein
MTLDRDLAYALDPALLLEAGGVTPDPWLAKVMRGGSDRTLLLATRQGGKSTTAAAIALHEALFRPPALVLVLSPSLRQSGELFRKVTDLYGPFREQTPPEEESALRLELKNGSRIVSLPGTERTVRSYSGVRLLLIDEAARVPDELYFSVRPMLAVSSGRLICLSTPFGRRGFFFEEWTGSQRWNRVKITADDCPRISREFLEEERASLGDWAFRQEYLCEFVNTDDQYFDYAAVMQAVSSEVEPLFPAFVAYG